MHFDLVDSFFGLSLFKQLALIFLTGPLVASAWALLADRNRAREAAAVRIATRGDGDRKAA